MFLQPRYWTGSCGTTSVLRTHGVFTRHLGCCCLQPFFFLFFFCSLLRNVNFCSTLQESWQDCHQRQNTIWVDDTWSLPPVLTGEQRKLLLASYIEYHKFTNSLPAVTNRKMLQISLAVELSGSHRFHSPGTFQGGCVSSAPGSRKHTFNWKEVRVHILLQQGFPALFGLVSFFIYVDATVQKEMSKMFLSYRSTLTKETTTRFLVS